MIRYNDVISAMLRNLWFSLLMGLFVALTISSAEASVSHFSKNALGNTTSHNNRHHLGQAVLFLDQSLPLSFQDTFSQHFKKQYPDKMGSVDFKMGIALLYLGYERTIVPGLSTLTLIYPYHNFP